VVAISALEALAHSVAVTLDPGTLVGAWMDAHRQDVFSALFRVGSAPPYGRDRLIEIDAPAVGDPRATLERWTLEHDPPAVIVGDGAMAFANLVDAATTSAVAPQPLAGIIALMALSRASDGETVGPAGVQPIYVRRPDAEIARTETRGLRQR
jgi:tRNA A37 threonylcarbamoyladenosine modification protein TsaB